MSRIKQQLRELNKGLETIASSADVAIGNAYDEFKKDLSEKDYLKWKELFARLILARVKSDDDTIKSLENDIKKLLDEAKLNEIDK